MTAIASDVCLYEASSSQVEKDKASNSSFHSDPAPDSYYQNYPAYLPADNPPNSSNGYYVSVNLSTLAPLVETPLTETFQAYGQSDREQPEVYDSPSTPASSNNAYNYYLTGSGDQVLCNSCEEEELSHHFNPNEEARHCFHFVERTMGNASSVAALPDSGRKKGYDKQSKDRRSSASSSDNGGFEPNASKAPLGVKEKLRHSLDKISLRVPFRWSSSDKLTRNIFTGSSKSKNKNIRRYSDSTATRLAVNPMDDKKKSKHGESSSDAANARKKKVAATSRMVRVYSAGGSKSTANEISLELKDSSNSHDYVNLATINTKMRRDESQTPKSGHLDHVSDSVLETNCKMNADEYHLTQSSKTCHDAFNSHCQPKWESENTATRAKGTWKMLKSAKTKQLPIKAGSFPSHTQGEAFAQRRENDISEKGVFQEYSFEEPPKLAPVSGKLLLDKSFENTVLRPTAFRPAVPLPSRTSYSPEDTQWEDTHAETTSREDVYSKLDQRNASVSSHSNHSDSGRHSATSIPAAVTIGSSFSCSGSEGYESARISSSTTHSTMQERDCHRDSTTRLSPKKLTDDVVISDLESRVKERQDEVMMLRRNLEDNQKTLHDIVHEDRQQIRETDIRKLKQKYSHQLKSQTRNKMSAESQQNIERQYRLIHDEQQQLHDTNKELEDRIKTMTDAIDAQSRQNEDIAELKARLEESEIEMQQKHGEISLLKRQVKDKQTDLTQRSTETIALKSYNRELVSKLTQRDSNAAALKVRLNERDQEIAELERRLAAAPSRGSLSAMGSSNSSVYRNSYSSEVKAIKDVSGNPRGVSICSDATQADHPYLSPPSPLLAPNETTGLHERLSCSYTDKEDLLKRLHATEHRCAIQERQFEQEKRQWVEDKRKVIKYQKQLQDNYVQICKRCNALEREVKVLSFQLQTVGMNEARVSNSYPDHHDISYPMEI